MIISYPNPSQRKHFIQAIKINNSELATLSKIGSFFEAQGRTRVLS
jgi:hypothetical protein